MPPRGQGPAAAPGRSGADAARDHGRFHATAGQAIPPFWWLAAAVLGVLMAVAALTSIPARIGIREPVAQVFAAELT